jgi:hypothetical protein
MNLADYLKGQWQCTAHGGAARGYNFPPLAEMRSIWDQRYGQREWSPVDDWGSCGQADARTLVIEVTMSPPHFGKFVAY